MKKSVKIFFILVSSIVGFVAATITLYEFFSPEKEQSIVAEDAPVSKTVIPKAEKVERPKILDVGLMNESRAKELGYDTYSMFRGDYGFSVSVDKRDAHTNPATALRHEARHNIEIDFLLVDKPIPYETLSLAVETEYAFMRLADGETDEYQYDYKDFPLFVIHLSETIENNRKYAGSDGENRYISNILKEGHCATSSYGDSKPCGKDFREWLRRIVAESDDANLIDFHNKKFNEAVERYRTERL